MIPAKFCGDLSCLGKSEPSERGVRAVGPGPCYRLRARAQITLLGLGIANRVYCIIAAEGLERPTVVHSFAAYKALVGHLQRGGSISHAFPSEADARLYFARARVDYPSA